MDAMKSRIWCGQGNLHFLNDVFLQSKFKRPDCELHCFIHLMTSKHEGWSLRDVLRGLSPISSLLESNSTQSWPADPAVHWPAEQWTHCVGELWTWSWWCLSSPFRNGYLPPRKESNHSWHSLSFHFGSFIGESAKSAQTLKKLQEIEHWWVRAMQFMALLSVGISFTLQECEERSPSF